MKHLSLLMLMLCLALTQLSYLQNEYNPSYDLDFIQFNYFPINYTPTQKVNKITFDEKGRITEWIKTNGSKKIVSYRTWKWNQNGNMTESVQYKRDTTKIKSRWVYDYVDNKIIIKSARFSIMEKEKF